MKRALVTAAIALLVTGATAATGALASTRLAILGQSGGNEQEWRTEECRYGGLEPGGWAQREVVLTIECAVSRWPVAGGVDFAVQVAACESGLQADAWNPGGYAGVFQHAIRYWPSRVHTFNPDAWDKPLGPSAFTARSNVVVAIRMAHQSGWGAWSCAS